MRSRKLLVRRVEQRPEVVFLVPHRTQEHTRGKGVGQLLRGDAYELRLFPHTDLAAGDVGCQFCVDLGEPWMARRERVRRTKMVDRASRPDLRLIIQEW